ncbi:hypothetical protein C8A00DRAFT_31284 [Chaetomidium leptoderma]|uniref:NACHT domain-containing protein n=1 Tax=Chaetomidium leptoderma TaxID=669021 RepID=A0AAN7A0K6_9PEZI|nr:hypothetical protein C8A00DRAFT_31284 [Chaetomidium leptoderma]
MDSGRETGPGNALSRPYRKVHALLIRWKDIDDAHELEEFETQLNGLADEFRQYRYNVEHYEIESESPHKRLSQRLHDFSEHGEEETLLVVYYGGHGRKNSDSHCLWIRDNPEDTDDADNPYVNWSALQILFFNDSAIVAAGFEQVAPLRGPDSFTTFLTKVLKDYRRKETPMVASVLARQIAALLNSPQLDTSSNERVTPQYIQFHDGEDSILIAPAQPQGFIVQVPSGSRRVLANTAQTAPSSGQTTQKPVQDRQQTAGSIRSHIKNALSFQTLDQRESNIPDAHTSTLSWILDDEPLFSRLFSAGNRPVSEFRSWLQEDGKPIFWISGKAGSGKSTLMKWIYQDPRFRERLRRWSKNNELLLCHFFFFERGEVLQKSREGLLRSILLQLFEAKKELVEVAFPECFDSDGTVALPTVLVDWESLKSALKRVLAFTAKAKWSVCMMIDGLDEYRNNERVGDYTEEELEMIYDGDEEDTAWGLNALISDNHREVVKFFVELTNQPTLKMCLSSREIPIIDLKLSEFPRFRLHQHTESDIRRYVSERFSRPTLRLAPEDRDSFVPEIVNKALGVFLWVRLVVDLVLERRITGDGVPQLRELLRSLPAQLGGKRGLYMSMVQIIRREDQLENSRILRLLRATATWNPLTAVIAPFALRHYEQNRLDVDKVEAMSICLCKPLDLGEEQEAFRLRLRSRFYGLFECESPDYKLRFSHQTVNEFFSRKPVWDQLNRQLSDEGFDANLALLASHIMLIKTMGKAMVHESGNQFAKTYVVVADAMHYAQLADRQNSDQQAYIRLVDELDRTMTTISTLITPCKHAQKCHWPHWEPVQIDDKIRFLNHLIGRSILIIV